MDGSLEKALDAETFPQGCSSASLNLTEVRGELWGGFVWINLDPDAEPLREYLDVIPAHLDPYHFEEMSIANEYTLEIACNWKTCMDAFHESYHIAGTHPDTLDPQRRYRRPGTTAIASTRACSSSWPWRAPGIQSTDR